MSIRFRWFQHVEEISRSAWAMLSSNSKTGSSFDCSIVSIWFLWSFWVVNASFYHFFWVIIASIVVSTTSWSSRADVCKIFTCILSLNASIEWCLWWASFGFFQNLEDKSMNALGPNIYWPRWGAQSHCTCFGAVSLHAICAIQGHQHKKVYSPACVNEILSLISKILSLQSLIFSSLDKIRSRTSMLFHF